MTKTIAAFFSTLLFSAAVMAAPVIGEPAPDFKGMDAVSGKEISLSEQKGKIVVLEWHNPGCPFVKKHYSGGAMQKLQADAAKDGVVWISINSAANAEKQGWQADATAAKAMLAEVKSNAAHYILDTDGKIGKAYEAKTTPHMFVVGKDGKLAYMGAIDSIPSTSSADIATATPYVADALAALKNGTPVKEASTKAYGCGVKY